MKKLSRWFRAKSLYSQLMGRLFIVIFFLLIIVESVQYVATKQYIYSSKEDLLESRLHNVEIDLLRNTDSADALVKNAPEFIRRMIDLHVSVSIVDQEGAVFAAVDENQLSEYQSHLLKGDQELLLLQNEIVPYLKQEEYQELLESTESHGVITVQNKEGNPFLILTTKVGSMDSPVGLIQLSTSISDIQDTLSSQIKVFGCTAIGILFIGFFLLRKVMTSTLKPIRSMTKSIGEVSSQDLAVRIKQDYGQEEIDQLAGAYNEMLMRMRDAFQHEIAMKEKMRQFVSDASHELRTPLTSIHGFAEVLFMGAAKDEKQLNRALLSIMNESDRLTQLVNNLLTLNRLDQNPSSERNDLDLKEMLEELKPQLELMAGKRQMKVLLSKEPLFIYANKNQIKQVVINLVQNAVQFTDEKTGVIQIEVKKNEEERTLVMSISDNGLGMSRDSMEHIFDRFYRGQEHRSRSAGGYGLGLAIVKAIVEQQGAKITVSSKPDEGTTLQIIWEIDHKNAHKI